MLRLMKRGPALLTGVIILLAACVPVLPPPAITIPPAGSPSPTTTAEASPSPLNTPSLTPLPVWSPPTTPAPSGTPVTPTPAPIITPTPTPAPVPAPTPIVVPPEPNFEAIDLYVQNTPDSAETSIEALAAYLVKPARSELEKVRAIYRWITLNISYDALAFLTRQFPDQRTPAVFARRVAVCEGYSNLFESMGKAAGLTVAFVGGWAKGYGYRVGDGPETQIDHAWNAVELDNKWYLLDSTWDAGYLDESGQYVARADDGYFMMLPEQFIYTHFPEEDKWQLLASPMTRDGFNRLPMVNPLFFQAGLGFGTHTSGVIEIQGEASLTISAAPEVLLAATLDRDGVMLPDTATFYQRSGGSYRIDALFPRDGTYFLKIYAKRAGDPGKYKHVLEYRLDVKEPSVSAAFPKIYQSFSAGKAYLDGPMSGVLPVGTVAEFKLVVPDALEVVVILDGNDWHTLSKSGDQFQGKITVARGEIQVAAKYAGQSDYAVLLAYSGE